MLSCLLAYYEPRTISIILHQCAAYCTIDGVTYHIKLSVLACNCQYGRLHQTLLNIFMWFADRQCSIPSLHFLWSNKEETRLCRRNCVSYYACTPSGQWTSLIPWYQLAQVARWPSWFVLRSGLSPYLPTIYPRSGVSLSANLTFLRLANNLWL